MKNFSVNTYRAQSITGVMAAGTYTAAPVMSFRWAPPTSGVPQVALIRRIAAALMSLGTGFAAGVGVLDVVPARAFTASDTGGGVLSFDPAKNNGEWLSSQGASLVADFRTATVAALGAGTRVLDDQPIDSVMFAVSTATNTVMQPTVDLGRPTEEGVMLLAPNEGFIIRATVPITGTWQARFTVVWDEGNPQDVR